MAAEARGCIRSLLQKDFPGGDASAEGLAGILLAADAAVLVNPKVDAELAGATCCVVRIEGLAPDAEPGRRRRLAVAHLGDCRAILGRREDGEGVAEQWSAVRLTEDHRPGDEAEAARIVSMGGRIRKAPLPLLGPFGSGGISGASAQQFAGPSRLWHRSSSVQAPGLAMSRGLGDALGQGCGLSAEAATSQVDLAPHDCAVVVGSDGIFDVLSDAEVLHCCRVFWPTRGAAEAANAVVAAASQAWSARGLAYRDDCTCAVLFL